MADTWFTNYAAQSGDPFAVQQLLGHADLQMARRYVQDVSIQTDRELKIAGSLFLISPESQRIS